MAIDYAVKYASAIDERFTSESQSERVVNQDYDFTGVKTVKVYSISTSAMNDYSLTGTSRYGTPAELDATTQEMLLSQDRSFTFTIDKLAAESTEGAMAVAANSLNRQLREKVIPEIDKYRYDTMATNAGNSATPAALDKNNIYSMLLDGTETLNDNKVPLTDRILIVTSATLSLIKQSPDLFLDSDISAEKRARGIVGMVDGMDVLMVASSYIGTANFGFMITHPIATTSPRKLSEYRIHEDAPGVSGYLVEGRVVYDAFVLGNKANAIYLHTTA